MMSKKAGHQLNWHYILIDERGGVGVEKALSFRN